MRICTWNIHAWGDAAGRSRVDDVIGVLAGLQADVVVLNEVLSPGGPLLRLSRHLDRDVFFGPAAFGGNAVLAPRGATARSVTLAVKGGEVRNALVVDVGDVVVVAVHLDHRRESVRCAQLRVLWDALAAPGPHLLVGDLNAIDPLDLPLPRYREVAAMRARHGHEAPRDDVVRLLRAAGYVDTARIGAAPGPLPERLQRTCWAGTRVDHVWLDRALSPRITGSAIHIVDSDASDHEPVVVDLTLAG